MGARIRIVTKSAGSYEAKLTGENPLIAQAVWDRLPIEGKVNTWGDEIYFNIPVKAEAESTKPIVSMGDVAYWPPGSALCIFFGPTPASWDTEIRPASPVNVFAHIESNAKLLRLVPAGEKVRVERA